MLELSQTLQTIAFLIALVELIIGLYVLFLDPRERGLRSAGISLLIIAAYTAALGQLTRTTDASQSFWPTAVIAATMPVTMAFLLMAGIALFQPVLAGQRWVRRVLALIGVFSVIPAALTAIDLLAHTRLWFIPVTAESYVSGYIDRAAYVKGSFSLPLNAIIYWGFGAVLLIFLLYIAITGRSEQRNGRVIAIWMILAMGCVALPILRQFDATTALILNLASSASFLITFTLAAFQYSTVAHRGRGSLQTRLTVLSLIITLPLLAAMGYMQINQARISLEQDATASLASINQNVVNGADMWFTYSTRALRSLTANNDIISMEPNRQVPILQSLTATYPDIYFACTVDLDGLTLARSDGRPQVDYSLRTWFREAAGVLPVSYNVELDMRTGSAALVVAMPIRDANRIVGVAMFSTQLTQLERMMRQEMSIGAATVMIINDQNSLVATSEKLAPVLGDMSTFAPVQAMRKGTTGAFRYTDFTGTSWISNVNFLSNGWGVIVQEKESSLFAPIRAFQIVSLWILVVGGLILMTLTWLTIRQAMQPVRNLTETAAAITAGDLSRMATVSGEDELSKLAQAFNAMISQLRDFISSLENRVSERTRDLERRAVQLQVTADVAREAATIRDPDQLLQDVVRLISERFGFYHAGIFLLEGRGGTGPERAIYAVLRAASSEGGQRMLRRGHRLSVGQSSVTSQGIVGSVAASGKSRIALDVGKDVAYFNNPDLPMTRSEMALPLRVGDKVIGVLDVQSRKPSAFNQEDEAILQTMADLLAVAIENVRLLDESQQALRELESLYGMQVQQGWKKQLGNRSLVFRLEKGRVRAAETPGDYAGTTASPTDLELDTKGRDGLEIEVPIEIRGVHLGTLHLKRSEDQAAWTPGEIDLAQQAVSHMAQALENARLIEEVQNRASQEEQINQMVARTQGTLSMDSVMRTAVQEIVRAVNTSRVQIRLGDEHNHK